MLKCSKLLKKYFSLFVRSEFKPECASDIDYGCAKKIITIHLISQA